MKNNQFQCVVIGGGAAGMMAAITAARSSIHTVIIEHTSRLGSKILATGNGKCNFTNLYMNENMYQNEDKSFVRTVLDQFGVDDTLSFFQNIGVYHRDRNGYVYPNSETAASLQDAMRLEVDRLGIEVILDCNISKINKNNKGLYQIETDKGLICAQTIIMATGSKAAPKSGSDGSGYTIAKQLGHHIRKPLPALVQLISNDKICKPMSGVRSTGEIKLYVDGEETAKDTGEIQYTDYGISGIPVFQISRYAVEAIDKKKKTEVIIDLLPAFTYEALVADVEKRAAYDYNKTVEQFFSGLINKKLIHGICKRMGQNHNDLIGQVGIRNLVSFCKILKSFSLVLSDFKTFEQAQICQGGVSLKEINPSDMQSKILPGLFFAGELVDVDGKCGGYNLQWAWSSGVVAAHGAAAFAMPTGKGRNVKN